jgi:hypothetical protein
MNAFRTFLVSFLILVFSVPSVLAEDGSNDGMSSGEWEKYFEVYGWLPNIYLTTAQQDHVTLTLGDLIKNLDMLAMFDFGAHKDKWSFGTDILYMNLGKKIEGERDFLGRPITGEIKLDMRAFISTVNAGYQIAGDDMHRLSVIGGLRYLYIRLPVEFDLGDRISKEVVSSGHTWDGIVGLEGKKTINDQWYMDYYGDIGTGDSDLTWQAKLGFGYQFNKFTGTLGFRYLRWNFDDKGELENLRIIGPYVGARWVW